LEAPASRSSPVRRAFGDPAGGWSLREYCIPRQEPGNEFPWAFALHALRKVGLRAVRRSEGERGHLARISRHPAGVLVTASDCTRRAPKPPAGCRRQQAGSLRSPFKYTRMGIFGVARVPRNSKLNLMAVGQRPRSLSQNGIGLKTRNNFHVAHRTRPRCFQS